MTKARDNATQGGLVLLNKTNVSGAASVSINNIFSSTYQNYKIVASLYVSTSSSLNLRLRSSSTDRSGSYYFGGGGYRYDGATYSTSSGLSSTSFNLFPTYATATADFSIDIYNPFDVSFRTSSNGNWFTLNNAGYESGGFFGGWYSVFTQDDGVTFYPGSGTITGNIRVYGYRN